MRLLVLDEELIPGGVETLRLHLLPALARHCEILAWALPAHVCRDFAARFNGVPNLVVVETDSPRISPQRVAGALLRRTEKIIPQNLAQSAAARLREAKISALARRHRCTHILTTCVFSQPFPDVPLPVFGFVCDVNPAMPEQSRKNIARWLRKARGIFAISEFTRNALLRIEPGGAEKIHAVPLAAPALAPQPAARKNRRFDFYCPAAANPHKNHRALFQACLQLARTGAVFQVALSGPGVENFCADGSFLNAAMEETRKFFLEHHAVLGRHVNVRGMLAADTAAELFGDARCVVLPSGYEGFGLPLAEALQRGLPVICSDIPPFREQLALYDAHDCARMVAAGDAEQLTRAMGDFLKTESQPGSSAETARRMSRWTWDDVATRCLRLLSSAETAAISKTHGC